MVYFIGIQVSLFLVVIVVGAGNWFIMGELAKIREALEKKQDTDDGPQVTP